MSNILRYLYKNAVKPVLFQIDAEVVHDGFTLFGSILGRFPGGMFATEKLIKGTIPDKKVIIDGVELSSPVGLAAGFDYTGRMARVMKGVGFGFNTVGTVTARPYEGNRKPRLLRLPTSRALLVNKGFKSPGAQEVKKILDAQNLAGQIVGISVGSSNIPEVDTIEKAIADYCTTLSIFKDVPYVSYFEINISCPNACISEQFAAKETLSNLLTEISKLNITKPLWLKMANEITEEQLVEQIQTAMKFGVKTFILSNLVKHRDNAFIAEEDRKRVEKLKGNFSGKPTEENTLKLIAKARQTFGKEISIIGLGGIFSPEDAQKKIDAGADAVQLITGMIYEGPWLIGDIIRSLKMR